LSLLSISAISRDTREIIREIARLTGLERWLARGLGGVLLLEGLAAMAPLLDLTPPALSRIP
jgi:hypothetical protein